jgi:hypothetical protein
MRYGQLTPSYRLDNVDMEALMATSAQLGLGKKKLGKQVCLRRTDIRVLLYMRRHIFFCF